MYYNLRGVMIDMIDWDEALKLADQLGIKYVKNSKTPGLYTVDTNGIVKKANVEELFGVAPLGD